MADSLTNAARLTSAAALCGLMSAASAQLSLVQVDEEEPARRYAVEIILFRYADSVSSGTEVFLPDPPPDQPSDASMQDPIGAGMTTDPDTLPVDTGQDPPVYAPENGLDTGPSFGDRRVDDETELTDVELEAIEIEEIVTRAASIELQVTPPEERVMTAEHERLLLLDAYQPVLWSGWTQIVRDEASTPAVNLRRLGRLPLDMDGELTLYLGRFVHLVVDVELRAPGSAVSRLEDRVFGDRRSRGDRYYGDLPPVPPPVRYRINEDQIMRNGDFRYFDHPKFGVLAHLSLIEEEDEPPETIFDDSGDLLPGATGSDTGPGSTGAN